MQITLSDSQLGRLAACSAEAGLSEQQLALRYVDEGLRMDEHPLVYFVDGPAGRRASLRGNGDVWEVVATIQDNDGDVQAAAAYLGASPASVEAAQAYYEAYSEEVDFFIEQNRQASD